MDKQEVKFNHDAIVAEINGNESMHPSTRTAALFLTTLHRLYGADSSHEIRIGTKTIEQVMDEFAMSNFGALDNVTSKYDFVHFFWLINASDKRYGCPDMRIIHNKWDPEDAIIVLPNVQQTTDLKPYFENVFNELPLSVIVREFENRSNSVLCEGHVDID